MHGVVGYSPGVFDLFHVGHLDLLRRAGAECDRLVVGVLTDELAEGLWGARPVVPLIERMEIVGHVRQVAEAVPLETADLRGAWRSLGFHRVFTGCPDCLGGEDAERDLAGTGVPVTHFTGLAETGSPVLRDALLGSGPRTSVA
ncbi:adenylyltransferase/cytidyltransferase family protein [Actinomadura viridis]|uniref:ethanolamine-phosphate cytidylyltransferase n=1 Tax=Actinomadura viridis TaxID=58110 RepID=A0A931DBH3_9ACTN|nr:adenylyltransferase/cytidyltransferase family protein [Actinomadura viridis]MBG6087115.1 glycerol-3-phosphate cytidylyltransferase [Actinomadura viridis]